MKNNELKFKVTNFNSNKPETYYFYSPKEKKNIIREYELMFKKFLSSNCNWLKVSSFYFKISKYDFDYELYKGIIDYYSLDKFILENDDMYAVLSFMFTESNNVLYCKVKVNYSYNVDSINEALYNEVYDRTFITNTRLCLNENIVPVHIQENDNYCSSNYETKNKCLLDLIKKIILRKPRRDFKLFIDYDINIDHVEYKSFFGHAYAIKFIQISEDLVCVNLIYLYEEEDIYE